MISEGQGLIVVLNLQQRMLLWGRTAESVRQTARFELQHEVFRGSEGGLRRIFHGQRL